MKQKRNVFMPVMLATTLATALSACGGGGDSGGSTTTSATSSSAASNPATTPVPSLNSTLWPATAVNDPAVTGKEPDLPAIVCATVAAQLGKNSSNLLDASVDANPANSQPDAARIQSALNSCAAGQAVKLVAGSAGQNAFLTGPLTLASGVSLWIDQGVTLFASRSPADYQIAGKNSCGGTASSDNGCNPLISVTPNNSGVYGPGTVDGRGGAVMTSGPYANTLTWWDVGALTKTLSNANQNNPRLVQVNNGTNFVLYQLTLQNAPKFHVVTSGTSGATIWGNKLLTPSMEYSVAGYKCQSGTTPVVSGAANTTTASTCFTPDTTKNTDGIDPGQSQNVLIAFNHVSVGDDGIAIKSHTSPASSNIQILHNRFYYTHGMSIGSETDSSLTNVTIKDMTVDGFDAGATSGFRIKTDDSRGGLVSGVLVDGLCTRRVQYPLLIDDYYGSAQGSTNKLYPQVSAVTLRNVHNVDVAGSVYAGKALIGFRGYSYSGAPQTYPLQSIQLDNVVFDSTPAWGSAGSGLPGLASYAQLSMGPGPVSFAAMLQSAAGANNFLVYDGRSSTSVSSPYDCTNAFVPFPAANAPTSVN